MLFALFALFADHTTFANQACLNMFETIFAWFFHVQTTKHPMQIMRQPGVCLAGRSDHPFAAVVCQEECGGPTETTVIDVTKKRGCFLNWNHYWPLVSGQSDHVPFRNIKVQMVCFKTKKFKSQFESNFQKERPEWTAEMKRKRRRKWFWRTGVSKRGDEWPPKMTVASNHLCRKIDINRQ